MSPLAFLHYERRAPPPPPPPPPLHADACAKPIVHPGLVNKQKWMLNIGAEFQTSDSRKDQRDNFTKHSRHLGSKQKYQQSCWIHFN